MTDTTEFIEDFLKHDYDPVKAHEYYLRTRQLKGRKAADAAFEKMNVDAATQTLNRDLKKNPKVKPTRRISEAERKVIRARALAMRIPDPKVRARMLARVQATEAKLKKIMAKHGVKSKKATTRVDPRSKVGYNGKPLPKPGTRKIQEDEIPEYSPSGSKLKDYSGHGMGRGTYADGSVYDGKIGWTKNRRTSRENQ